VELSFFAIALQLQVHIVTMRSNIFVPDRNGCRIGTENDVFRDCFSDFFSEITKYSPNLIHLSFFCIVLPAVSKPIVKSSSLDGGSKSKN